MPKKFKNQSGKTIGFGGEFSDLTILPGDEAELSDALLERKKAAIQTLVAEKILVEIPETQSPVEEKPVEKPAKKNKA